VLEGACRLQAGDHVFERVGSRTSVFDGPPAPVVLVEPGMDIDIEALTPTSLAVATAPGGDVRVTRLVEPWRNARRGAWQRWACLRGTMATTST